MGMKMGLERLKERPTLRLCRLLVHMIVYLCPNSGEKMIEKCKNSVTTKACIFDVDLSEFREK